MALLDDAVELVDDIELRLEVAAMLVKEGRFGEALDAIDMARSKLMRGVG